MHPNLSIVKQCKLIGLTRSNFYYKKAQVDPSDLKIMHLVDEIYTEKPFFGSRKIAVELSQKYGFSVNRKRVQGIMRRLGVASTMPGPNTSKPRPQHKKLPYLLRNYKIIKPLQVWSSDITYLRLPGGFVYLTAVIDWFSRFVLAYRLSNSLDGLFCLEAFEEAIANYGRPLIFNTDQGVQYTAENFVKAVLSKDIQLSMDGRGRALDNIFVERLWRSVKYEDIYLKDYQTVREVCTGIETYFNFYNLKRPHQALGYKTPYEVHHEHMD